jgi:hypothetical protein
VNVTDAEPAFLVAPFVVSDADTLANSAVLSFNVVVTVPLAPVVNVVGLTPAALDWLDAVHVTAAFCTGLQLASVTKVVIVTGWPATCVGCEADVFVNGRPSEQYGSCGFGSTGAPAWNGIGVDGVTVGAPVIGVPPYDAATR